MGIFDYVAAGTAAGFGRGAADYGALRMREIDAEERYRQQLLLQRERERAADERLAASLAARGRTSGSGGGGGAALADLLALDDAQLARLREIGGMPAGDAADLRTLERGEVPGEDVPLPATRFSNPDRIVEAGGDRTQRVAKYAPGDADALAQRGYDALLRAVGLTKPDAADDIAAAESERQKAGFVKRYSEGDERAGQAAMVAQGRDVFNEDGNVVTGEVPKGSVAAATVAEKRAQAGKYSAQAREAMAEVGKIEAEIKGDIAGKSKERLATMLNSLNAYVKDMNLSDEDIARINELRAQITAAMREEVSSRPGGGSKPAPKPANRPPLSSFMRK